LTYPECQEERGRQERVSFLVLRDHVFDARERCRRFVVGNNLR
jgi:hypothetical protein